MTGTDKTGVIHHVYLKNAPLVTICRRSHGVYAITTRDANGQAVHITLHKHTLRALVLYCAQWLFDDVVAVCRNKLRVKHANKKPRWPWYLRWLLWFR